MLLILRSINNEFIKSLSFKRFEIYQNFYEKLIPFEATATANLITENEKINLYDLAKLKQVLKKHNIIFVGKFSQKINKSNSVSKLIEILEKKQLLKNKRFKIKINKKIPIKAGLGGGSMNAASILRYFIKKKIINPIIHINSLGCL